MKYLYQLLVILTLSLIVLSADTAFLEQQKNADNVHDHPYHPLNKNFQKQINEAQSAWVAGDNDYFKNQPMNAVKQLLGRKQALLGAVSEEAPVAQNIPQFFDSRDNWSDCQSIKEIRDQSYCGCCWAFATVEVLSDRICIFSNQTQQTRISAQNMCFCCTECLQGSGWGCNGGDSTLAMEYVLQNGLVTGDLYDSSTSWCQDYSLPPCDHHEPGQYEFCPNYANEPEISCSNNCASNYPKTFEEDKHYIEKQYVLSLNVEAIQTEIMTNGPVVTGFNVFCDFMTYKTGVYFPTTTEQCGGHNVKIIGWGEENGLPYWLIANSWNSGWGENGTVKFLRGSNSCGIEQVINAAIPKITSTSTVTNK